MELHQNHYAIAKLTTKTVITSFDCGDSDLNHFLTNDATTYQNERLAVTHLCGQEVEGGYKLAGYFCLLTDKLMFDPSDEEHRKEWKIFNKKNKIHFNKHRKSYPAVKIGRLAVANDFAGQGIGRQLIYHIIGMVADMNSIACRFITVDAYRSAFDFYLKNGFDFLSSDDNSETTRVMYLDIKHFN
jgi:GNAT superfamily N-acetyltransferase